MYYSIRSVSSRADAGLKWSLGTISHNFFFFLALPIVGAGFVAYCEQETGDGLVKMIWQSRQEQKGRLPDYIKNGIQISVPNQDDLSRSWKQEYSVQHPLHASILLHCAVKPKM